MSKTLEQIEFEKQYDREFGAPKMSGQHSLTVNDEWVTPERYVEMARKVLGSIELDPASTAEANRRVKAKLFYSKERSALDRRMKWCGKVWMNPPYSRIIKKFITKFCEEWDAKRIKQGIVLTNNGTDTQWAKLMHERCSAICTPHHRIAFELNGMPFDENNKGQVFWYFGKHPEKFAEVFSEIGQVYQPWSKS